LSQPRHHFCCRRGSFPARVSATKVDKSIAVLPFENLSKDEENAFFAGGVQDEILTISPRSRPEVSARLGPRQERFNAILKRSQSFGVSLWWRQCQRAAREFG